MAEAWLMRMTWEEFQQQKDSAKVVIVPVGSTEQHGPHLPLGTDALVAITLAEDAAARTGAVIAPPLWYGWAPHHMALPGTVTVRPEILTELLFDVTQSLHHHGISKFVYVNGHRIVNIPWMQIAAERAQRLLKAHVVIFDPAFMSKDIVDRLGFGPLGHAEEIESSHMYFRHPELCRPALAIDFSPEPDEVYSPDPRFGHDTLCYVPSTAERMKPAIERAKGATGSPTRASAESGRLYHEHLVRRLCQVIESMR
jgi:creatinine amidohydrolase